MPAILLAIALFLPIWIVLSILVSPLWFWEGKPRRIAQAVWRAFPAFMEEAARPD